MIGGTMRDAVIAGLFVASAALVGVLLLERIEPADDQARIGAPADMPAAVVSGDAVPGRAGATAAGAAMTTMTTMTTILGRPLFEPNRRPVTAATLAGAPADKLPRLTGVLVTPTGRRVIFASPVHGKPVIATEGTRIGNFVVQSIASGEVTVLGPDGVHTIRPAFDTGRATPALAGSIAPSRPNTPAPRGQEPPAPQAPSTLQAPPASQAPPT